jgi:hypothetical protein
MSLRTLVLIPILLALAAPAAAMELRHGERLELTGEARDVLFAAGREIDLSLTSPDDVFAAGREIRVRDARADHLHLAAREVTVASGEVRDLVALAADVNLDGGRVADDVTAAGGELRLGRGFAVGGSATLAGGEIALAAPVGGDLAVAGGTVRIDSAVTGRAEVTAERLVLGPNARIGGDLIYRADSVLISPQAVISGQRIARPPGRDRVRIRRERHDDDVGDLIGGLLVVGIGGAVLTLVLALLAPGLMRRTAERLDRAWPASLGLGLLLLVLAPFAFVAFLVTVIGLPLAFVLLLLVLASLPLAYAVVVHWAATTGRRLILRERAEGPPRPLALFGWALLAALVLVLLGQVPVLGALMWLAVWLLGLGALAIEARRALARA